MNSIQDSYLKALNPTVSVKIQNLDAEYVYSKRPKEITKKLYQVINAEYESFLDEKNGVIYIGKKV